jgi:hypothetical protein
MRRSQQLLIRRGHDSVPRMVCCPMICPDYSLIRKIRGRDEVRLVNAQ